MENPAIWIDFAPISLMKSAQMSRMHNRVLLLQQELELCRGAARNMEPSVPEKQFQQLTTAHAKAVSAAFCLGFRRFSPFLKRFPWKK